MAIAKPTPAPKAPPKQKSAPKPKSKNKGPGRPGKSPFLKAPKAFKTAATGETRNSPMTDPNIVFWLGVGLIIFSGWSSGRIKNLFSFAWNGTGQNFSPADWLNGIKIFGSQFLFLFLLVITARAIPPLARIWLVIIGGMWILYIMKNPQIVQLLNWTSVGSPTNKSPQQVTNQIADQFIGAQRGIH